jgi:hypothetical protein
MNAPYYTTSLSNLPSRWWSYPHVSLREVNIELLLVTIIWLLFISSSNEFVHIPLIEVYQSGVLIISLILKILRGYIIFLGDTVLTRKVNSKGFNRWVLLSNREFKLSPYCFIRAYKSWAFLSSNLVILRVEVLRVLRVSIGFMNC